MPNLTENYGLKKPLSEEFYDVQVQNENMDIIDEALGKASSIVVSSEVPEDAEFWIDPNEVSAEESHLTNMNNPHNVTREQIGAAPSDYGLGMYLTSLTSLDDANNATKTGWYRVSANTANCLGSSGILCVDGAEIGYCRQTAIESKSGITIRRYSIGGTWSEYEWVNPPMTLGVEYRTTERCEGKVVYAKRIAFGAMPNNTYKNISHGITCTGIVRYHGTSSTGLALPSAYNFPGSGERQELMVTKTNIFITSNANSSANTANVSIYYTKD